MVDDCVLSTMSHSDENSIVGLYRVGSLSPSLTGRSVARPQASESHRLLDDNFLRQAERAVTTTATATCTTTHVPDLATSLMPNNSSIAAAAAALSVSGHGVAGPSITAESLGCGFGDYLDRADVLDADEYLDVRESTRVDGRPCYRETRDHDYGVGEEHGSLQLDFNIDDSYRQPTTVSEE